MSETPIEAAVDPITLRQQEVDQYDAAIATYKSVFDSLPSEWPASLEQFRDRVDRHQAIAEIEDLDDVALVSDLWAHDDAGRAIRAHMVERAKANAILLALQAQQA